MSLEHAILGFLSDQPRSGYDLKTRCFDSEAKAFWSADQAQIYRTLERLKSARLVTVRRFRQNGRPDRKVYDVTPSGRATFETWETSPSPLPVPRNPFLLQVYLAGGFSDEAITQLISARRTLHQARLEELRAEAIELAGDPAMPARVAAMRQAAYDGAITTERATIDWLDDTLDAISDGRLPASENPETKSQDPPSRMGADVASCGQDLRSVSCE